MTKTRNLSPTSYNKFRTCPRLYYWEEVVRIERAREDGARRFGTLYHAGLEHWWRAMDGGDVPWRDTDAAIKAALEGIANNARHVATDPYEVARAEAMMVAYHTRYISLEFETVDGGKDVEVWFGHPLVDADGHEVPGWRVVGKKDARKRFANGRIQIVEHKQTTMDIKPGSDYWARLAIDTQISIYVDAAQRDGLRCHEVLYDVSRKPDLDPLLKTPEEKRRFTKGKGCSECGGRAGGKLGVAQGTGKVPKTVTDPDSGKSDDVLAECVACNGTGWKEAPRLDARQRTEDENVNDFKLRVAEEIAEVPDAYFRMGTVTRSPEQLAEARQDLVVTSAEIDALINFARRYDEQCISPHARTCFPRNAQTCTNIYGRRCDFLDVCSGAADPFNSPLYQIKGKRS